MSALFKFVGKGFLVSSYRSLLKFLIKQDRCMELDETKMTPPFSKEDNVRNLTEACEIILDFLQGAVHRFPMDLRACLRYLYHLVEKKFPGEGLKSVGGFFFLRFLSPILLFPDNLIERTFLLLHVVDGR